MKYLLLVPVMCIALAGCKVDPVLQAEFLKTKEILVQTTQRLVTAEGKIAEAYQSFRAGTLTKEQFDAALQVIKLEMESLRTTKTDAEANLTAIEKRIESQGHGFGDVLLNVGLALVAVMTGRRLGVPGLKSKAGEATQ